jgi:predicted NodU family carbamoyl transferase
MVDSPMDALECFGASPMDALALGDHLVWRAAAVRVA